MYLKQIFRLFAVYSLLVKKTTFAIIALSVFAGINKSYAAILPLASINKNGLWQQNHLKPKVYLHTYTQKIPSETLENKILFSFKKNKKRIIIALKTATKKEANLLYENYCKENSLLIHKLQQLNDSLLTDFSNPSKIEAKEEKFSPYGLTLEEQEDGAYIIVPKPDFYLNIFKGRLTNDYNAYLSLISAENKEGYAGDAALAISFASLGKRIIAWEFFFAKYPKSKLVCRVFEQYLAYQRNYIFGMDNTPTYGKENYLEDDSPVVILKENSEEFDRFIKSYPKSPTTRLVNLFIHNFKNKNLIELFQSEQNKQNCQFLTKVIKNNQAQIN